MKRVLAARLDNNGDVLLIGPALRAIAASGASVDLLCGPRGEAAARTLPTVGGVLVWEAAWIDAQPKAVTRSYVDALLASVEAGRYDEAIVFTSFHQSPLPLALLLRMAAVRRIGAVSVDYAGTLLDVRHFVDDDVHEVQRALSLAGAMGYALPRDDDGRLRMRIAPAPRLPVKDFVVVHPGATVPARTWIPQRFAQLVQLLRSRNVDVVVTGSANERKLTHTVVADTEACDFGGKTSFAEYASILAAARAVVTGNTSAAHVAAAVGTPIVSIFPPTIPLVRFRPWMVPAIVLGNQDVPCAGCRARECPVAAEDGQPCLSGITPQDVFDAIERLAPRQLEMAS
jgi:ADP-heptose:LPS heptosyltransferase